MHAYISIQPKHRSKRYREVEDHTDIVHDDATRELKKKNGGKSIKNTDQGKASKHRKRGKSMKSGKKKKAGKNLFSTRSGSSSSDKPKPPYGGTLSIGTNKTMSPVNVDLCNIENFISVTTYDGGGSCDKTFRAEIGCNNGDNTQCTYEEESVSNYIYYIY